MRSKRHVIILICAAVSALLAALLWPRPKAMPLYRVIILPSLGGRLAAATGVNDRGQVTGFAQTAAGAFHFFLWDRENGMRDLGPAIQGNFYINDAGQIAGTTQDAAGKRLAFLWDRGQGMRMLGTLGGRESMAEGLNNCGQVIGWSHTATGPLHAFIWDQTAGLRDLGTLGGAKSYARWIDDAGQVLGLADSATEEYQPFFWDSEAGVTAIGPPAPALAAWYGMNNRGYAVGVAREGQLFLWRRDIGTRELLEPGGSRIQPVINDANQILFTEASYNGVTRWLSRFVEPAFRCYLWDPERGRISLDDCVRRKWGKTLYLWDLNNQGCIVGVFGHERRLRGRAVLLEPIPERWGGQSVRQKRRGHKGVAQ